MADPREIAALRAYQGRDSEGAHNFSVGDLVTPLPDMGIRGAGDPFIVLEVHPSIYENHFSNNRHEPGSGDVPSLRVATFMPAAGGKRAIATFLVDHAKFVPWEGAVEAKAGDDASEEESRPTPPYLAAEKGDTILLSDESGDWPGQEVRVTDIDETDTSPTECRLLCRRLDDPLEEDERWIINRHVVAVVSGRAAK